MRLARNASVYSNGVSVKHEICRAMEIIDVIHKEMTSYDATFTSIVDGKHKDTSRHYLGMAVDIRNWLLLPDSILLFVVELKNRLGPNYNVLIERTHIHVSFRPIR